MRLLSSDDQLEATRWQLESGKSISTTSFASSLPPSDLTSAGFLIVQQLPESVHGNTQAHLGSDPVRISEQQRFAKALFCGYSSSATSMFWTCNLPLSTGEWPIWVINHHFGTCRHPQFRVWAEGSHKYLFWNLQTDLGSGTQGST